MKCDDCPVGGQHDYGANHFNPFDENGMFPVGRVYPAHNDKPQPIAIAVDSAGNVRFVQQGNSERFVEEWRNRSDKDKRRVLQRITSIKPAVRKGWICPRCDNAVSPDEKTCPHCKPKPKKESDGGERTHITETD